MPVEKLAMNSGNKLANNFPQQITNFQLGVDTSDATATADNIQDGYTAYVKREKLSGTLQKGYTTINNAYATGGRYDYITECQVTNYYTNKNYIYLTVYVYGRIGGTGRHFSDNIPIAIEMK